MDADSVRGSTLQVDSPDSAVQAAEEADRVGGGEGAAERGRAQGRPEHQGVGRGRVKVAMAVPGRCQEDVRVVPEADAGDAIGRAGGKRELRHQRGRLRFVWASRKVNLWRALEHWIVGSNKSWTVYSIKMLIFFFWKESSPVD